MLKPRPQIVTLPPYLSPIVSREGLNLDLNENTAGCSERVMARLRTLTKNDLSMYPVREVGERTVARFLEMDPAQVLLTNGIDDALLVLFSTYLAPEVEIVISDPTFVLYSVYAAAIGAKLVRVPSAPDLAFPLADLLSRITPDTRVIVIANPNNPTGTALSRADLLRIADAAPDAAVLVDEAYFEFHGETVIDEAARRSNLFVARTFSKAYGLAGLRLGVLTGPLGQMEHLRRFCSPFNVNAVALACLEGALADQSFAKNYVAEIRDGRERLHELCSELGIPFWPSRANFVLVKVGPGAAAFVEAMQQRGIRVRDSSASPGCAGCVRITIGTREQMDGVLVAAREALAAAGLR